MVHVISQELTAVPKRHLNSEATGQLPLRRSWKLKQGAIDVLSGHRAADALRFIVERILRVQRGLTFPTEQFAEARGLTVIRQQFAQNHLANSEKSALSVKVPLSGLYLAFSPFQGTSSWNFQIDGSDIGAHRFYVVAHIRIKVFDSLPDIHLILLLCELIGVNEEEVIATLGLKDINRSYRNGPPTTLLFGLLH